MSKRGDAIFNAKFSLAQTRKMRGKGKAPVPPKPISTRPMQLFYLKMLRNYVKYLHELVRTIIIPQLPDLMKQANNLRPDRADSYTDDIKRMVDTLRKTFFYTFTDDKITNIAVDAALKSELANDKYFKKLYTKMIGIDVGRAEPWLREKMAGYVSENVTLIKSLGETAISRVEKTLMRTTQQGWRHEEVAKELIDKFGVDENSAKLIARDQTSKFNASMSEFRFKNAGVEKYVWSTSGDDRVRESHAVCDGHTFTWNSDDALDGNVSKPDGFNPGEDINCRCVALPVFEEE